MVNGERQTPLSHPGKGDFSSSGGRLNTAITIPVKARCLLSSHVSCDLQQSVMWLKENLQPSFSLRGGKSP